MWEGGGGGGLEASPAGSGAAAALVAAGGAVGQPHALDVAVEHCDEDGVVLALAAGQRQRPRAAGVGAAGDLPAGAAGGALVGLVRSCHGPVEGGGGEGVAGPTSRCTSGCRWWRRRRWWPGRSR